jgi:hypothetical protein
LSVVAKVELGRVVPPHWQPQELSFDHLDLHQAPCYGARPPNLQFADCSDLANLAALGYSTTGPLDSAGGTDSPMLPLGFPLSHEGVEGGGVDSHQVGDHQPVGRAHRGVPSLEYKLEPPIPSLYHLCLLV